MKILISENVLTAATTETNFKNFVQKTLNIQTLQYIDEGSDGVVYGIDNNTVVKFQNVVPINEQKSLKKQLPNIVKYFNIGTIYLPEEIIVDRDFQFLNKVTKLNALSNKNTGNRKFKIYYLIMQRLSAAPYNILEHIEEKYDEFERQHPTAFYQDIFNFLKHSDKNDKKDFALYIDKEPDVVKRYLMNLYSIMRSLKLLNITYTDFHWDQFGVDENGNLTLFDLTEE